MNASFEGDARMEAMLEKNSYDLLKSTNVLRANSAIQLSAKARMTISINKTYRTTDFTHGEDVLLLHHVMHLY